MSLQLLLGGSGYGKSHYIFQQVIERSLAYPDKYFFILVPEQYTMQVQKRIVELHPDHATMNIDVVSFGRLAYRIFDELNMQTLTVLDDIGKSMVIRRIVNQKKSKLKVFGGNAAKTGFISEMKSTLSELMQYQITPNQLAELSEALENRPALRGKLQDIGQIYQGFMDYISEKYITTEQILDQLLRVVGDSELIRKSEFYLDAFTGFTPAQYEIIRELLLQKIHMMISLTVDVREDVYHPGKEYDLFHLTKDTIHRLNQLCRMHRIEREEDICLTQEKRYDMSSPLGLIERNLYRRHMDAGDLDPSKAQGSVRLLGARNPVLELEYVAEEIHRLARAGYRYRDMAIVTGNLSVYSHVAENAMRKAGIPVFIDETRDILADGFVEFVRALLDIMVMDFSYDSVFRCLKTGWMDIDRLDIDLLENYVLATGIRGYKMWSSSFVRRYKGLLKDDLMYLNQIREQVMAWLEPLRGGLKESDGTAAGYSAALLDYFEKIHAGELISGKEKWFSEHDQMAMAREYHQIYRVMKDLLSRMDEILRDETMTLKNYKDVLDAGMTEARIGIIPPGMDQVMVGDLRRTRLGDIKILFFVGVNEGLVPAEVRDGGLINDNDKDLLKSFNMELAPTGKQDMYTERFYIYAMLTNPTDCLYLSYVSVDQSGNAMQPSSLIDRVKKILPELELEDMACDKEKHIYSFSAAKQFLADQMQDREPEEMPKEWYEIYHYMCEHYADTLLKYMQAAYGVHEDKPLSKAAVRAIYGKVLSGSVTMLEQYASCAYEHFLNYGLNLEERREYHFGAPDMGMLFHSVLELFTKRLMASEDNWHTVTDEGRDALVSQCVQDVVADEQYLVLMDSFRNQYMIRRLDRMAKRTIWALQKQIIRGSFEPSDVELRFGSKDEMGTLDLKLSEDEILKLSGVIDRVDTCEKDNRTYVRIIDYKTGKKKFDLTALYHGLQLQLVVYMEAAMDLKKKAEAGHKVIPAGILYYNIDDPVIAQDSASVYSLSEADQMTQGQLDQAILKALKMNGLVNEDHGIPHLMEAHPEKKSDILPLEYAKDGVSFTKASGVASTSQFADMFAYSKDKVTELGKRILAGDISVQPYRRGASESGCTYCPYHGVCHFDEGAEGFKSRRISVADKDAVFDMMHKEVDHEHDLDN